MRSLLILALIATSLCLEDQLLGGWEKVSKIENDPEIDNAFLKALSLYATNINTQIEDLIRLSAYTKLVNGKLYNITFIDRKAEYPTIHEYTLNKPIAENSDFEFVAKTEYDGFSGLISFTDPEFSSIELELYKFLKKDNQTLNYISYVYPIVTDENKFFIINADTNGLKLYVIGQDRKSKKYNFYKKIKEII